MQVDFYTCSRGVLVARRDICALKPGLSLADGPNHYEELYGDSQYAGVV